MEDIGDVLSGKKEEQIEIEEADESDSKDSDKNSDEIEDKFALPADSDASESFDFDKKV